MDNFNEIKNLHNKINSLLLDIKEIKSDLYEEYSNILNDSIMEFVNLGAKYVNDNPQEFQIFLNKLYDIIKILNFIKTKENIREIVQEQKRDRCLRIADRKFDKPSAYKSGAVVRCRKGDIWKGLKEGGSLVPPVIHKTPKGQFLQNSDITPEIIKEKTKETLHKWFARKGPKGKEGGWVDCNTCKDGSCKACGRKKGEKRSKYPSCRPTPAQCKLPGKGEKWGKTK